MLTAVLELQSGPGDEVRDRSRYQHLAAARERGHTLTDVNGDPRDVVATEFDLTGVQSGPHLYADVTNGVSDSACTLYSASRSLESG